MKLLRFTLRDLLWLAVLVGLGLGWWIDRQRSASKLEAAHRSGQYWQRCTITLEQCFSHFNYRVDWDHKAERVSVSENRDMDAFFLDFFDSPIQKFEP